MFKLLFVSRLKIHIRTKESIFWLLMFPILLATLFKFAFSNLLAGEKMETINVAIVEENASPYLKTTYENVFADESFNVTYTDIDKAKEMLEDEEVSGYIDISTDTPQLTVKEEGIEQTVLKEIMDYILQEQGALSAILEANQGHMSDEFMKMMGTTKSYIREVKVSDNEPNLIVVYFYTVLAMAAMYGAISGMEEVNIIQANQSKVAMRINLGGVSKMKVFLVNLLATCIIQSLMMIIILLYIRFALGIDFGSRYGWIALTSVVGAITGVAIGTMVGAVVKKGENFKTGVIIGVTMLCSFLSGMMGSDVRVAVREKLLIVDQINPVSLITDSYYQLFYFDKMDEYAKNIAILLGMAVISIVITINVLRKQQYNNI